MKNRRKWRILMVVLVLAAAIYLPQRLPESRMNDRPVEYTRHAQCRMECRTISKEEVLNALRSGKRNPAKSDPDDRPCPTTAWEDRTSDGQRIRIISADCGDRLRIVTAIDLDNEYECHCP